MNCTKRLRFLLRKPHVVMPRKPKASARSLVVVGETLYVTSQEQWRNWLEKNHQTEREIWLVYYLKSSGKPRISYEDALREALCYGWIDGIVKKLDDERIAQRWTPRRDNSVISAANRERAQQLIDAGRMTPFGLAKLRRFLLEDGKTVKGMEGVTIPKDIEKALKQDQTTWENFQKFSVSYQRVRIGWIEAVRGMDEIFQRRLSYFLKMTKANKQYGALR